MWKFCPKQPKLFVNFLGISFWKKKLIWHLKYEKNIIANNLHFKHVSLQNIIIYVVCSLFYAV